MVGKIIKYFAIVLIAIIVASFIYLNTIVKSVAQDMASRMTGTTVSISAVAISPFSGNVVITGLDVGNPEGFKAKNAIEFSSININIDTKTIFKDKIMVKKIEITNPMIHYEFGIGGDNVRRLLSNVKTNSSSKKSAVAQEPGKSSNKKVVIKDLYLKNGRAELVANMLGYKAGQEFGIGGIHLQNIGEDKGGASVENITALVLEKVVSELAKARSSGLLKDAEGFGDNVGNKIKSLF